MKYAQKEWMEIHAKTDEGRMSLCEVNFDKNWNVTGIEVTHSYGPTLSSWGTLLPKFVDAIVGKKQFVLNDDMTVSLFVNETEFPKFKIRVPDGIKNPKVIPFSKWKEDYFKNYNRQRQKWDQIHSLEITGCAVNSKGYIAHILSEQTSEESFGCFGRNVFKDRRIEPKDILIFTYGMCREDICDEWCPDCCGTEYHAYFNENYDLVYDDDGQYYINKGYFS